MKILEQITEPLILEGKFFGPRDLLEYCRERAGDPDLPEWQKQLYAFIALFLDPQEPEIVQLSSGTTGDPKSHMLDRDAMINSARRTLDFFKFRPWEKALLCLPVNYIAGKMMVVRALLGGMDLQLREPSSRPLLEMEDNIHFAAMVPLQIEESLRHGDPLERITSLLIGGGELFPATRGRLSSMRLPEVYETFGMTETYTHFALKRINGPDPDPAFRVLDGVRISRDQRGCLEVEVPGVTTARVITNDLVEIHEQGSAFTWQGRFDNLINSGGIKILPELLEEQVRDCLGHECLVLPEADRKLGQRLVLLVEYSRGKAPMDRWMEQLRKRLSAYEVPRRIVCVDSLPRNPSMKPDRTRARELLL